MIIMEIVGASQAFLFTISLLPHRKRQRPLRIDRKATNGNRNKNTEPAICLISEMFLHALT